MPKSPPKEVKFFDTVLVSQPTQKDDEETRKLINKKTWDQILDAIEKKATVADRTFPVNSIQYVGRTARPTSPPLDHIALAKVRDRSDAIGQMNMQTGDYGPLDLPSPEHRVQETTYIVPIGQRGRVAVVSPGQRARERAIGQWITGVLGLATKGKSIELIPVVDDAVLQTLQNAHGATSMNIQVQASTEVDATDGGIAEAVKTLQALSPSVGTLRLGWSLGREASDSERTSLRDMAIKVLLGGYAKSATASLREEVDDKIRTVQHNLLSDVVVFRVRWDVDPNEALDEVKILDAVSKAIKQFVHRYPVSGSN